MPPVQTIKKWTFQEVLLMQERGILPPDNRLELIRGELVEMSPSGRMHAAMVNHVVALLQEWAGKTAIVWGQTNILLQPDSAPEPDIALLSFRKDRYFRALPQAEDVLLLIEVADASIDTDRKVKAPLYAQAGIPEYWIIDLNQTRVERYTLPGKEGYGQTEYFGPGDKLRPPGLGAEISVERVFGGEWE